MRTTFIKVIIRILKTILAVAIALIFLIGGIGGGWGAKQTPGPHPFYSGDKMLIAHRGVTDQAPENTIASTQRAIELGFSAVEIDIKESADSQFYLFHDRVSTRLFNKSLPLEKQSLGQLQKLPLYHEGVSTRHRVPELNSFIRRFANGLNFYVDVKRHGNYQYEYLADKLVNFLESHQLTDKTFVGSDFLFTVYLEYYYPEIHTVFTGPGDNAIRVYNWIPRKFRPDFIISYANEVTESHLKWLKSQNLINRRMLYGVDGGNYEEVKKWGIPILVVDYDSVMDKDLSINGN